LDYHARQGTFRPQWYGQDGTVRADGGSGVRRKWSAVDLAAATAAGQVFAAFDPVRAGDVARLIVDGVYLWWGEASWIVVAQPRFVLPARTAEEVVRIAGRFTCCTVVPLPDPLDD
jgi:hypothetical protein